MEDKSYKDKIEEFFAQNSEGPSPTSTGDEAFFESAWKNIQEDVSVPGQERPFILWSAILLLGLLLTLSPNPQQSTSAEMKSMASNQATNVLDEAPASPSESEPAPIVQQEVIEPFVQEKVNTERTASDQDSRLEQQSFLVDTKNANKTNNKVVRPSESSETAQQPLFTPQKIAVRPEIRRTGQVTTFISSLRPSALPFTHKEPTIEWGPINESTEESIDQNSRLWSVGVYSQWGQTEWRKRKEQFYAPNQAYQVSGGDYREWGITSEWFFHKNHGLGLDLGYSIQEIQSDYVLQVNYTQNGEFSDGQGNLHNQYQHTLPTIIGDVGLNHVLYRESTENIQEGQEIEFELSVQSEVRILPVKFSYLYHQPLTHRLAIRVGAGINYQYILSKELSSNIELISHHDKIHHNYTEATTTTSKSIRESAMNAQIRAGLVYSLGQYDIGLMADVQETIIEAQINQNHFIHPTIFSGRLSISRRF